MLSFFTSRGELMDWSNRGIGVERLLNLPLDDGLYEKDAGGFQKRVPCARQLRRQPSHKNPITTQDTKEDTNEQDRQEHQKRADSCCRAALGRRSNKLLGCLADLACQSGKVPPSDS